MGAVHSVLRKNVADLFASLRGRKKASVAILGLDAAGKTTLVTIFRDPSVTVHPTLGFNMEKITFGNTSINIWDIGGQREFISFWKDYVEMADGLIFIIDIADNMRFKDSYAGFLTLVSTLRDGLPVLLLLNKCDLFAGDSRALDERQEEIEKIYHVDNTSSNSHSYIKIDNKMFRTKIYRISAKDDVRRMIKDKNLPLGSTSVYTGFKWIVDEINDSETRSRH